MQQNLIDRAIESVAPSWALSRAEDRVRLSLLDTLKGDTAMALDDAGGGPRPGTSKPARRWWNPFPGDARSDTLPSLPDDRAASRELAATNPIAAGAINTNIDRVVGSGLALVSQPNAVLGWSADQVAAWKQRVQAEFSLWADGTACDYADTNTFYELQAIVLRSTLESGDCFTNMPSVERTRMQPYGLRLQVIEADRVGNPGGLADTPNMAAGVRFGKTGAPDAFHVYKRHPGGGYVSGSAGKPYAGDWVDRVGPSGRKRILHHFRKRRPEQPRGVPYLAPIVDIIKQLGRYTEAEITAAVITAYLTVFIETPTGNPSPIFDGGKDQESGQPDVGLGMGAVVGLAPGEKATSVNPGRPNPNFGPFIENVITQIGMALGLPRELLIKQFNSSYSASKAALLDAWIYIRNVRVWLAGSFCQPVFETWLSEAVAIGRVSAPGFFSDPLMRWAYTRAAWPGDSMGSINPKDEVAAYTAAIDARLMTRERAEWELFSSDFNETLAQKEAEQMALAKRQLLPVPKAGAAAPAPADSAPPKDTTP
jgi:lambda family phage portal protein